MRLFPSDPELVRALGDLHPIAVHFPIALLLTAAAVEFMRRKNGHRPLGAGVLVAMLGGAGGVVAAYLGLNGAAARGGTDPILETHRYLGLGAAGWTAVVALCAAWAFLRPSQGSLARYRFALVVGGVVAGLAGHFGGAMVHGPGSTTNAIRTLARGSAPARPEHKASARGDFALDVRPLLAARCAGCHSGPGAQGGLRVDDRASLVAMGANGKPRLVPGRPSESEIIARITSEDPKLRMPPKGAPLTPDQVAEVSAWVSRGAPFGQGDDQPWHWAYRAPVRENPPAVADALWPRNAIDAFVLARLEREGLRPSAEADELTLLRRVSLDLTGLPPTAEEIDEYRADVGAERYERAVERLLGSSAYAERMAGWWLDLARYADTHGYEKDARREIWPYRDWVIEAFAADMPFDRFSAEQLAGDELEDPSVSQLVATGFNRNTMTNEEGGVDPEEFRVDAVHDRVRTFSSVWLGSTVACAQCHDHKHDPFTQKDYYRLFAYFNNDVSEVTYDGISSSAAGGVTPVPRREERQKFDELLAQARISEREGKTGELEELRGRMNAMAVAHTMVMKREPAPRQSHVFAKGSFLSPGDEVDAGTPAVLHACRNPAPTRAALAEWVFDPKNPLAARVAVNRLWEMHFGRGIVETSDDFGSQGTPPSHPALLDWLATEFVRREWSVKAMHRLIVTSAAYRQSSVFRADAAEKDASNALLWRYPRTRLDAEFIRDAALTASGLLSRKVGGPSVFPPQPEGVWTMIYSSDQWKADEGESRFRRGLYTFWRRTAPFPTFTAFDATSREIACTRRARTNTPLQALTTLNDPAYVEAAIALAARMKAEGKDTPERITRGFVRCLTRTPTREELVRLTALYESQVKEYADPERARAFLANGAPTGIEPAADPELAALAVVANVMLNLDEAITRE
ncbi:MAG: DUF1553 domain-containing protein [Phycisphaerales bacterium]